MFSSSLFLLLSLSLSQCDDGNVVRGDGCSNCTVDAGWVCVASFSGATDTCYRATMEHYDSFDSLSAANWTSTVGRSMVRGALVLGAVTVHGSLRSLHLSHTYTSVPRSLAPSVPPSPRYAPPLRSTTALVSLSLSIYVSYLTISVCFTVTRSHMFLAPHGGRYAGDGGLRVAHAGVAPANESTLPTGNVLSCM